MSGGRHTLAPHDEHDGTPQDPQVQPRATVIDVFANDRVGLLYTIAKRLTELEANIVLAKISTHGRLASDAFYVTDVDGHKIMDPDRVARIQEGLLGVLHAEAPPAAD